MHSVFGPLKNVEQHSIYCYSGFLLHSDVNVKRSEDSEEFADLGASFACPSDIVRTGPHTFFKLFCIFTCG